MDLTHEYQKLIFSALLAFLVGFPLLSNGQITITAEEGFIPFEKIPYTYIKNRGISFPDTGKNMIWDYSHFLPCDNCESVIKFEPVRKDDLVGIDRSVPGAIKILGFPVKVQEYYGFNEAGDLYRMGERYKTKVLSLKRLSGHRMDKLKVQARDRRMPILEYDFPFEYGKTWQTVASDTIHFVLNGPSVNLEEVHFREINVDSVEQAIVGYGKLKIPYFEKGNKEILTYDALLLKKTAKRILRIEGDLSEESLNYVLSLAGLQQQNISTCVTYKFYVKEMPLFVLTMSDCYSKKTISRIRMRTNLDAHRPKSNQK